MARRKDAGFGFRRHLRGVERGGVRERGRGWRPRERTGCHVFGSELGREMRSIQWRASIVQEEKIEGRCRGVEILRSVEPYYCASLRENLRGGGVKEYGRSDVVAVWWICELDVCGRCKFCVQ